MYVPSVLLESLWTPPDMFTVNKNPFNTYSQTPIIKSTPSKQRTYTQKAMYFPSLF